MSFDNYSISAIIFDKDGALPDFDAFWISTAIGAVSDIIKEVNADENLTDELLASIGASRNKAMLNGIAQCKQDDV